MRSLGAARTSGFFVSVPFVGMLMSFLLLREGIVLQFIIAVPLLIIGVLLLTRETHSHEHRHLPEEHEHCHRHDDDHHVHEHTRGDTASTGAYHTHPHIHAALRHLHAHLPDIHHRHAH